MTVATWTREREARAAGYYALALRWQLSSCEEVRAWAELVALRAAGGLPDLVVDLLDAPNATVDELVPLLSLYSDWEATEWALGIVLGRLSLALRTGERSQPEAIDVLRAAADLQHPLADVAASIGTTTSSLRKPRRWTTTP